MKYYVVDAFAEKVFEGNPAGVCVMDEWLSDELMQKIAMENNLSETAFAVKQGEGYRLRWFTPGGEINLCGHATLATAYVIMNFIEKEANTIHFHTMSGQLIVQKRDDWYELDFPAVLSESISVTAQMMEALGLYPIEAFLNRDLVFVLKTEEEVKQANPDFSKLEKLPNGVGVAITARGSDCDFVSRGFYPKLKVNEDPVTGSLHCSLVPYWSEKLHKQEFVAKQLSSRGGTLYCKKEGNRVKIAGKAVLYSSADIFIE